MTNILLVNKSPVSLCKTGFKRPPFNILTMSDEAKSAILCYHYFIHREEIYMTGEVLPSTQSQAQTGSQLHVEIWNMPLSWSFPPVPHTGPVLWARRNLSSCFTWPALREYCKLHLSCCSQATEITSGHRKSMAISETEHGYLQSQSSTSTTQHT